MVVEQTLIFRSPLDDQTIDACYREMLREKQLESGAPECVAPISLASAGPVDAPPLRLHRIEETSDVNRLVDDQTIEFNDRLTVIYGQNGSGKSGYARVLKQVAGARSADRVLSNVYAASPGKPGATIKYAVGPEMGSVAWRDGLPTVDTLRRICVFDTPATPLHLDDDLVYLYTPADLALFQYTHTALSNIRDRLVAEAQRRQLQGNPFLGRFRRGTPQFALVESLRATTDLSDLQHLAERAEDEDVQVANLTDRVRNLESTGWQVQLIGARATQALCGTAVAAVDRLLNLDVPAYEVALKKLADCEKRVKDVTEALFIDDDLPGLFTDEWKAFISATHKYAVAHVDPVFPDNATVCPYCNQKLTDESRRLLHRYKTHLVDDSQVALRSAAHSLGQIVAVVVDLPPPDEPSLDDGDSDGGTTDAIRAVRSIYMRQQQRLSRKEAWDLGPDLALLRAKRQILVQRSDEAERTVRELSTKSSDRDIQLKEVRALLLELEDRCTLRSLMEEIIEQVTAARWVDLADTVLRTFQGLLRSLTDAMKDASQNVLNATFQSAFLRECELLDCPPVRLEFPGRQGAALRHKSVGDGYRLGEILSEGEQKVIALADFLAEVSTRPSSAPIVLDDPITSLDARRIDQVAERIVKLSCDHQVIVFTHHLYFATKLLAAFEDSLNRSHCSFYEVLAEDGKVGLVARGSHPRLDTVRAIAGRINKTLLDAGAASGSARADALATVYGHMRGWIEAFVEDELLQGSVKRHRANISIDALGRVNGKAIDEAILVLQPIFTRACERMWPHAHTLDQLQVSPTLDEVEVDWEILQAVADAVKNGTFPIVL